MLSVNQVAAYFGCSVRKVWRFVAARELPQPLKIGRACRWIPDELNEFIENQKRERKS
jgi:excisionase family DNA binding protein